MRFLLLLGLFFVGACERREKEIFHETFDVNVAISSDYEPFAYVKDGKLTGFDVVLVDYVFKKLDKKVHFHDMAFQDVLKTVKAKKVDLAIAAISSDATREKDLDFSVPYHDSMTVAIVSLACSATGFVDLKDKIIGVEKGTTYEGYAKKHHDKFKVVSFERFPELVKALNDGKCDAILTGYAEAYSLQSDAVDLKLIPVEGTEVKYRVAFPKGSALRDAVDKQLETMIVNGELHELEKKFFKRFIGE